MDSINSFTSLVSVQPFQEISILHNSNVPVPEMSSKLSPWAAALFHFLPSFIRREVLHFSKISLLNICDFN
jgi:hypothetical protein